MGWERGRRKRAPSPSGDERLRRKRRPETRANSRQRPPTHTRLLYLPPHLAAARATALGRFPGAGRPGSAAVSRRSPTLLGPAARRLTCALPPVSGDHGLASDRVQPGGALGLLTAGVREGAETEREWRAETSRGDEDAGPRLRLPSRQPPALPPPPGPRAPAPSPDLYLMKKTRPPLVIP